MEVGQCVVCSSNSAQNIPSDQDINKLSGEGAALSFTFIVLQK